MTRSELSSAHIKIIRKWSASAMKHRNVLDLDPGVFAGGPKKIAAFLERSAMRSRHRNGTPLQSAVSMHNFHINRDSKGLTAGRGTDWNRQRTNYRDYSERTGNSISIIQSDEGGHDAGTENDQASER